jgi:hypothetical protein
VLMVILFISGVGLIPRSGRLSMPSSVNMLHGNRTKAPRQKAPQ